MKDDDVNFALKIDGVNLEDIDTAALGMLLHLFSKILGSDGLHFKSLTTGSTVGVLKTSDALAGQKLSNIHAALNTCSKEIDSFQKLLDSNPTWGKAHFLYKKDSANDDTFVDIHTFTPEAENKGFTFWQPETLRGRLFRLQDGKDKTSHIGITLESGQAVPMSCSIGLAHEMSDAYKSSLFVEVSGQAKYNYKSYKDFKLLQFKAERFVILDEVSVSQWIQSFTSQGESAWSELDDPIAHWLKERHQ